MRPPKPTSARLRLRRIEAKPKAIGDKHFVDNVGLNEAQKSDFNRLLDLISAGTQLDERYYRSGIDADYDELLDKHGVMHLHLELVTPTLCCS